MTTKDNRDNVIYLNPKSTANKVLDAEANRKPDDVDARMERIRGSLQRINELMANLKETTDDKPRRPTKRRK